MRTNLYSVFDLVAKHYGAPFMAVTDAIAIRSFMTLCRDPQSMAFQHPYDFRLLKLGTFDDDSGMLTSLVTPELVVQASDFQEPNK